MKGTKILVTPDPKGKFQWAVVNASSLKPGGWFMIDATKTYQGGRIYVIACARGSDGRPAAKMIGVEDELQGFPASGQTYTNGTLIQIYSPGRCEEVNTLVGEGAGTSNSFTIGDQLIMDAEDGVLVPYASTPQEVVAEAMETVTQVTANTLLWCQVV